MRVAALTPSAPPRSLFPLARYRRRGLPLGGMPVWGCISNSLQSAMHDLSFWIPCLGLPLAALFLNVAVRWGRGLPQSALTDLILCFVVFDALVAMQSDDFRHFIRIGWVREATVACYILLLFINAIVWALTIWRLEHELVECYEHHQTVLTRNGMIALFYSIMVCTMVIFFSVLPFAYRG
jgi:hypothetical protein